MRTDANGPTSILRGALTPATLTALLVVALVAGGCSQAESGGNAASAPNVDATAVETPDTVPSGTDSVMMQVTQDSLPPEPSPETESPTAPSGWTSRIRPAESPGAPSSASMSATAEATPPSSAMQSKLSRYAPAGGSAERMTPQEIEAAYAPPPSADAVAAPKTAMRSMTMSAAPMAMSAQPMTMSAEPMSAQPMPMSAQPMAAAPMALQSIEPTEPATAGSSEGLGPIDPRRMEMTAPADGLGAGNPAVQTRPDGSKWVKVFYATDRSATYLANADPGSAGTKEGLTAVSSADASPWKQHLPVLFCIVGTIAAAGFAFLFSYRKAGVVMLISGAGIAAVVFGTQGTRLGWFDDSAQRAVEYGGGRDQLRFGVCQVSLPPGHERGTMESPSLLKLEWRPDPKKHVALLETIELDREACLSKLNEDLAQSNKREIFLFVHGYNVSFEDAARRTGQLAHDLDFPGPAMCYSWPSQGTTAGYTIDENNVAWTVPHLKDVLQTLQKQTGADAVHVIAHSMGNRALTSAIRELALEGKLKDDPLGQIVLAAPDVDAEVFRRDMLPTLQASAKRVTLYASSYDRALVLSKTLHGYPRAGESGEGLVVAEGLETIDVSGVDLSLLGHSYYGDVVRVVDDLKTLIFENKAAAARPYLVARERQGLAYWQVTMQTPPVSQAPGTLTPR